MKREEELIKKISDLRRRLVECRKLVKRQKKVERALRKREKQYRVVVEEDADFICRHKPDSTFTFANYTYCQAYGISQENLIGKNFFPDLSPKAQSLVKKIFSELTPANPVSKIVHQAIRPTGEMYWQQWSNRGIFNNAGRLIEIQAVGRDISELKKLNEALKVSDCQLRLQKKAIEEKNIALQEILKQREIEKKQIEANVITNIEELIIPIVQKLKQQEKRDICDCAAFLELSLLELASSFGHKISQPDPKLSPRQIEISNLIKIGFSSKDIAQFLHLSPYTIEKHRKAIRKKLLLINKRVNLTTFLQNL